MNTAVTTPAEWRVLLRTATPRDAVMAQAVLDRARIAACTCDDVHELVREIQRGAGVVLLAEEVLSDPAISALTEVLDAQEAWSDLPVLVLARQGADSRAIAAVIDTLENVTVIERPVRMYSFVSSVRSALRARRRQYELRAVLDGLREADQRKTEFLATLAHELRNPLAPLSTALAILSRTDLAPDAARPYHELMGRQIEHMVRLINDLMEVSRITRGKIELRMEPLRLDKTILDAIELSRPLLAANHRLEAHIPDVGWMVRGDGVRLSQVFSNLLNNAAKYTPNGGLIRIEMCAEGNEVVVSVRDNGNGIPPDMLASVFDMFVQVSGTSRAAQGGLGIGLTLVRSLVELHGGTVRASSEGLGKGTEFRVSLPLFKLDARSASRTRAVAAETSLAGTILVVDDNRDAADTLGFVLDAMGASTVVAYNGEDALQLADSVQPEVAILDIGMPGMDGCELARRLRSDPRHSDVMFVAVTGWGQPADRERIASAGFSHHFLKPLDIAALTAVLGKPAAPN